MRRAIAAASIAALTALAASPGAGAATVVNGDFEAGNLSGWQVNDSSAAGTWVAYTGSSAVIPGEGFPAPVPPPPQGSFAAITVQAGPGRHVLYQDVALEPYYTHQLSLTAYYMSNNTISAPNSLSIEVFPQQQYRIDVMKPSAAVDSVDPADILATLFSNKTGDPVSMPATSFQADLTQFAGQTVRLRMAEIDNQGEFNAGVDAVSIISTPPSNAFVLGKARANRKKGTAKLTVTVPGPGTVTAVDARAVKKTTASAQTSARKTRKRIKNATVTAASAGTVKIPIKPTKAGRKLLVAKHKLRVKVRVSFTPTGGITATQTRAVVLKLK